MTARATRGPQWDVSSQLFQVDTGSHLYYDRAPLAVTDLDAESSPAGPGQGQTPGAQSGFGSPPPSFRRTPSGADGQSTGYNTNPATPSPLPSRSDMPPPSSSSRRVTRNREY